MQRRGRDAAPIAVVKELAVFVDLLDVAVHVLDQHAVAEILPAQGFANEVDQLYNRLSNCPVPSTPVYGRTPIFTCNNGCGCNGSSQFM